jgi:hypothetical protein
MYQPVTQKMHGPTESQPDGSLHSRHGLDCPVIKPQVLMSPVDRRGRPSSDKRAMKAQMNPILGNLTMRIYLAEGLSALGMTTTITTTTTRTTTESVSSIAVQAGLAKVAPQASTVRASDSTFSISSGLPPERMARQPPLPRHCARLRFLEATRP